MQTPDSRIHKPYYRNGPSHRDGADVSFQDIVKIFGFRTITIGKWVTAAEQQIAANLFFDADKCQPNEYVNRSAQADKLLKILYYARPQELVARAFEACIQDHFVKNAFLVQCTKQSPEAKMGIYPAKQLRAIISKNLLDYFYHLGQAVNNDSSATSKQFPK